MWRQINIISKDNHLVASSLLKHVPRSLPLQTTTLPTKIFPYSLVQILKSHWESVYTVYTTDFKCDVNA